MSRPRAAGMAQSVLDRLKERARRDGRPFAELLERFAAERFLHRLGRSPLAGDFLVKGAVLLRYWLGTDARPTRDVDLYGPAGLTPEAAAESLRAIFATPVEDDGIDLDGDTLTIRPMRRHSSVLAYRARLDGFVGRARLRYQIDLGLGDAVFPEPQEVTLGTLLGLPVAPVRAYTRYTTVAEKLEAMVVLGNANTRMKDYYDVVELATHLDFDEVTLAEAVRRCFDRRRTPLPDTTPEGLSDAFAADRDNQLRWKAFLRKGRLIPRHRELADAVATARELAAPAFAAARGDREARSYWSPGGSWREGDQ